MRGTELDTRSIHSGTSQTPTDSVKRKKQTSFIPRFLQRQSKPRRSSLDVLPGSSSGSSNTQPPQKTYRRTVSMRTAHLHHHTHQSVVKYPSPMECPLCLMDRPREHFPDIMTCEHRSCGECLRQYLKIEITESRVNIACPECAEPLHPNDIKLILQDELLMNKYEEFTLRRLLMMDSDCRWCPAPDCGFAVIAAGCANCPQLACQRPGCTTYFCYHCKQMWHPDQTCDTARQQRQGLMRKASRSYSQGSASSDQIKPCPRCTALIIKMDDGSCNHMSCAVCGAEFCWLCMKEISDLHYLSPSGCTFWGKKPWSRKKKILWQLGTLVGAPVGIALIAGIAIPAIIIGIPVYVGRKVHGKYASATRHHRNLAIAGSVTMSVLVSPVIAALTVGIGVPILLAYVYGVVPVSLCRSGGCGVKTSDSGGVRIEFEDDNEAGAITPANASDANPDVNSAVVNASINASIGEVSMIRESSSHLEVAGVIGDDTVSDNASTRAIAGASLTGSLSGSGGVGPLAMHRLDVHAEVIPQSPGLGGDNAYTGLSNATHPTPTVSTNQAEKDPLEVHVDNENHAHRYGLIGRGSVDHTAEDCRPPAEDVWELRTGGPANPASVLRRGSKPRGRAGKKNSVKISDRIAEAPCPGHDDAASVNSELSAQLADVESQSECSSDGGAVVPPDAGKWKGGGRYGVGDVPPEGGASTSLLQQQQQQQQQRCHQLGDVQQSVSLTEVEVDRPLQQQQAAPQQQQQQAPLQPIPSTDL